MRMDEPEHREKFERLRIMKDKQIADPYPRIRYLF